MAAARDLWRRLLVPSTRRDQTELMDEPGQDPAELAVNLRDIRRVNRMLGGTAVVLNYLPQLVGIALSPQPPPPNSGEGAFSVVTLPWNRGMLLPRVEGGREGAVGRAATGERAVQPVTILDLATGSADIPVAIARWAKRHKVNVSLVTSDVSPEMLALAQEQITGYPEIALARYDARAVPLPDRAVDVVLCSLALHHFRPDEAIQVLAEMDRLARVGFIVNDLRRSRLGYAAAWLAAQLTTRNRLTHNDAPLSVLRAYTPDELAGLLRQAGIAGATITTHRWFRMAAVAIKGTSDG